MYAGISSRTFGFRFTPDYYRYLYINPGVPNIAQGEPMRLWIRLALLAVCVSVLLASCPLSRAEQDQPETKRKIIAKVVPSYPGLARSMRLAGSVKIEAVVLPNGSAKSTQTLGGHPLLVQAAVDAVYRCKWEPAPHETKEIMIFNFHPD